MVQKCCDNGTIEIEYFWRTLEIPLINCCLVCKLRYIINYLWKSTNTYVLVITQSTQDNAKLLQQLKSGFNRMIN